MHFWGLEKHMNALAFRSTVFLDLKQQLFSYKP